MKKKEKQNNKRDINNLLLSLLFFLLGGILIVATEHLITDYNLELVLLFAVIGWIETVSFFYNKEYKSNYYNKLILGITFIWLALVFYKYYLVIINILPILFSL